MRLALSIWATALSGAKQCFALVLRRALPSLVLLVCAPSAVGVSLSPAGSGQVLLFPYYLASERANGFATLVSIVNTTPNVKAVRVRLRDGLEGRPVGDYNVYLDAYDVWTAVIMPAGEATGIGSFDNSCTSPKISRDARNLTLLTNVGNTPMVEDTFTQRSREGLIEVIEMGDYGAAASATAAIPKAVIHYLGIASCEGVSADTGVDAGPPTGGLFGSAMVISVMGAADYYYAATALDGFSDRKSGFGAITSDAPSLADAHPAISIVRDLAGNTIRSEWARGIDAVSAVLMTDSVQGEFVLEPATQSRTNWIVTMPTKWHYVRGGLQAAPPFVHEYGGDGACEVIDNPLFGFEYSIFSRAGDHSYLPIGDPAFARYYAFCSAATVMPFNGTWIFPSSNALKEARTPAAEGVEVGSIETWLSSGWARIALFSSLDSPGEIDPDLAHRLVSGLTQVFGPDGSVTTRASMTYIGLPVTGFAVSSYYNGTLTDEKGQNVLSTYIAGTALRRHLRVE